jgi:hypothetical protein
MREWLMREKHACRWKCRAAGAGQKCRPLGVAYVGLGPAQRQQCLDFFFFLLGKLHI